jgi:hypothetical protein
MTSLDGTFCCFSSKFLFLKSFLHFPRQVHNRTKIENFESSLKHNSKEHGSDLSCPPISRDICMTLGQSTTTSVAPTVEEQMLPNIHTLEKSVRA